MNKEEPKVLTRMRLSCCWGDNLNEKELNEVVDYINWLQQKVNKLETNRDELKKWLEEEKDRLVRECSNIYEDNLGKTKLVSEDIFNELTKVSEKIDELERGKE